MQILAAIDVGSNAMRIMVGRIVYDGKVEVIENLRLPVRLAGFFYINVLEKWTLEKRQRLFQDVFAVKLVITE